MTHKIFLCIAGIFVFSSIIIFTMLEEKQRKVIDYVPPTTNLALPCSYIVPYGTISFYYAGGGGSNLPPQLWPVTEDIAVLDAGGGGGASTPYICRDNSDETFQPGGSSSFGFSGIIKGKSSIDLISN